MSVLSLSKLYADSTLLFAADFTTMWTELETKTNGGIDNSNLATGWATLANITLSKDASYTFGATSSTLIKFTTSTSEFLLGFVTTQKDVIFKVAGTQYLNIETDNDFVASGDIVFTGASTTYPLSYLVGYSKPVLVYVDSTTIDVEQNTTTSGRTLVMTPSGPLHVTENTTSTSKFRRLKLTEYANGYQSTHTGAANSGFRLTLVLTANTWFFVYAVRVQGGDDNDGTKFILVADSISPEAVNAGTLNGHYGANNWIYIGLFRYGFGLSSTTTLVPFIQDKSGWTLFTGRSATDDFFGINTVAASVTSTSYATMQTYAVANSGNGAPACCSMMSVAFKVSTEGSAMNGNIKIVDGSTDIIQGPSFGVNLSPEEAHGFQFKIPNIGCLVQAKTGV